ncbi:MAG: hypothetical protein AB1657_03580 [Candidatus Micrarchaeota archaeon]
MPEAVAPPRVDGFRLEGRMSGKAEDLAGALKGISYLKVAKEKSAVSAAYVESRDISKNPYTFSIVRFDKDAVDVIYTVPPSASPTRRRMDVLRHLLNMLTLVEGHYEVDPKLVLQLLEQTVKEIEDYATADYKQLYATYDTMRKEAETLRRNSAVAKKQLAALSRENYELKNENDELKLKLESLQGMSEGTLRSKVQEWVIDHGGLMNVAEFSKTFRVPEARVEQVLDELVRQGFFEVVQ